MWVTVACFFGIRMILPTSLLSPPSGTSFGSPYICHLEHSWQTEEAACTHVNEVVALKYTPLPCACIFYSYPNTQHRLQDKIPSSWVTRDPSSKSGTRTLTLTEEKSPFRRFVFVSFWRRQPLPGANRPLNCYLFAFPGICPSRSRERE